MNSTCEQMKPLLSEYVDGALSGRHAADLERHLSICADCPKLLESLRADKALLSALPLRQTSQGFDAELSRRIAALNQPPVKQTWPTVGQLLWPRNNTWRPAVAAIAVTAVVVSSVMMSIRPTVTPQPAPVDSALIAHCVEQHRNYVEAQPLTDWSTQTLAGQLDSATSAASDPQVTD